jgi:DNA-binding XRE family transcriptional regulator
VEVPRSAVPESATPVDVDEIVSEIGPKVHALRSELGLSLQQMGALADVSAASIHKIERGEDDIWTECAVPIASFDQHCSTGLHSDRVRHPTR